MLALVDAKRDEFLEEFDVVDGRTLCIRRRQNGHGFQIM